MKLKIMIMALLLLVGIGSAVNRLPATEFVGDVNMNGYDVIDAKMGQSIYYVTVGPYDWCDYVTDGTADDVEIQAALDAMDALHGGLVQLTLADYVPSNTIRVPEHCTLSGVTIPYDEHINDHRVTRFNITNTTDTAFIMGDGACMRNIEFYYPNQTPGLESPVVYPATITMERGPGWEDNYISYCLATNPYIFYNASTQHSAVVMSHVRGFPLYRGIIEDEGNDVSLYTDIQFHPRWWYAGGIQESAAKNQTFKNGIAFDIRRCDWPYLTNCFAYGYNITYSFYGTNRPTVIGCSADMSYQPVKLYNSNYATITSGNFVQLDRNAGTITVPAIESKLGNYNTINNNHVWAYAGGISICEGWATIVKGNHIQSFARTSSTEDPAIMILGGSNNSIVCNNIIHGDARRTQRGITIAPNSDYIVSNNIISDCNSFGILIYSGSTGFIVADNVLINAAVHDSSGNVTKVVENNI